MFGVDIRKTSSIDMVKDNTDVSITFIHGLNDNFIKYSHSEKLLDANKSYDNIFLVEKAGHAESRKVLGIEEYKNLITKNIGVK